MKKYYYEFEKPTVSDAVGFPGGEQKNIRANNAFQAVDRLLEMSRRDNNPLLVVYWVDDNGEFHIVWENRKAAHNE